MGGCCAKAEKAIEPALKSFIQAEIAKLAQQLKIELLQAVETAVADELKVVPTGLGEALKI